MGADCSQRVCSFGRAFVDSPWGDLDGDGALEPNRAFSPTSNFVVHGKEFVTGTASELGFTEYGYARGDRADEWDEAHFYRECSNKGLCDRETGLCECFPGYEGSGCERTKCPNDCSGNGVCRTILESNRADADGYSAWDGEKTQVCECDAGWTGPHCGMRSCPKGADPILYRYKVTDSVQGIYWRTFASDQKVTLDENEHEKIDFLKDKPSKVYYTITFTDEYNDEWSTQLLSIDYTSFCKGQYCLSTPALEGTYRASDVAGGNGVDIFAGTADIRSTLNAHAEAANTSLLALPTQAIKDSYVWTTGNHFYATCTSGDQTAATTILDGVTTCVDAGDSDVVLKQLSFEHAPWDASGADPASTDVPTSTFVDSLDFRLDMTITGNCDLGSGEISFDGGDTEVFGECMFVRLPSPGVHKPLQVRFFYNPAGTINGNAVSFAEVQSSTSADEFTTDANLFLTQNLVVVQDLQAKRTWNYADGDLALSFSTTTSEDLPYCADRGICDFDSGICNCFSGYTGLRCEEQNAVTYSY